MINLQKGQKFNLSKDAPNLTMVRIGLGWDTEPTGAGSSKARSGNAMDSFGSAAEDPAKRYSFGSGTGRSSAEESAASGSGFRSISGDSGAADNSRKLDLDVSVFLLGPDGKLPQDEFFIFYNNLRSPDGTVVHQGDNRTGAGEGDDEAILINLRGLDPRIQKALVVVTIHGESTAENSFSRVNNAYIRLLDEQTGEEVLRYSLTEKFSTETALEFAELQRDDGAWRFHSLGQGSNQGLEDFVNRYA